MLLLWSIFALLIINSTFGNPIPKPEPHHRNEFIPVGYVAPAVYYPPPPPVYYAQPAPYYYRRSVPIAFSSVAVVGK